MEQRNQVYIYMLDKVSVTATIVHSFHTGKMSSCKLKTDKLGDTNSS